MSARPPTSLQISRRGVLPVEEATQVRIQLDQQVLNTVPGDERADLEVTEDTSPEAQALKAHSPPGKAIPIIYLIVGYCRFPRSGRRYRRCSGAASMAG
jgi:hypothetical protein